MPSQVLPQPLSPETLRGIGIQLRGVYARAEKQLVADLASGAGTDWKRSFWQRQQKQVHSQLVALGKQARDTALHTIPKVYGHGLGLADRYLGETAVSDTFARLHHEAVLYLQYALYEPLASGLYVLDHAWKRPYRTVNIRAIQEAFTLGLTRQQASKLVLKRLGEAGLWVYKDSAGRQWDPKRYAEMIGRTTSREATNAGQFNRLLERGHDLVEITGHANACINCQPWEGMVLSLTGATEGYNTLADAEGGGLFHPNCCHVPVPYIRSGVGRIEPGVPARVSVSQIVGPCQQYGRQVVRTLKDRQLVLPLKAEAVGEPVSVGQVADVVALNPGEQAILGGGKRYAIPRPPVE